MHKLEEAYVGGVGEKPKSFWLFGFFGQLGEIHFSECFEWGLC